MRPTHAAIAVLALLMFVTTSTAQEHKHGQGVIPDWYDENCCSKRDCRPVEDKEIEFLSQGGSDWVRHIPTDVMFQKSQWRTSQDERYHVCIFNQGVGWDGNISMRGMCVYIRSGA